MKTRVTRTKFNEKNQLNYLNLKDGKRIFIGGPGSWYWQGVVTSQNLFSRPDVFATKEGPYSYDNSYLGYSVASGYFNRTDKLYGRADVAVGVPKGDNLVGKEEHKWTEQEFPALRTIIKAPPLFSKTDNLDQKVVLLTHDLRIIHNISGEQLGSYFGYSITAGDIDGDSYDDLIVGAPLFTNLDNSNWDYENGRVYVIFQGKRGNLYQKYTFIEGKHSKARFGLALTSLGDINLDGFGDFAVGAPYDGPNERGAVYLYLGSASPNFDKPTQKILAEDLPGDTKTFGFSLSGGVDMDLNSYPDLIIGAYDSAHSFLFRSSPVAKIKAFIQFTSPDKEINLADKRCTIDGRPTACTELKICFTYSGIGVANNIDFDVKVTLDSKASKIPRMHFNIEPRSNVYVTKHRARSEEQACIQHKVYMKPIIRDKLSSLEAEMKLSLSNSNSFSGIPPVLDTRNEHNWRDSITIHKDCGNDKKCIPDLRLVAKPSTCWYDVGNPESP